MKTVLSLLLCLVASSALADGKLLGTPGASTFEGAGGGGLVPWATISGYGSKTEFGGAAFYNNVRLADFNMDIVGAAIGYDNRWELSAAHQVMEAAANGAEMAQTVYGAKLRLAGDLIFTKAPQLSVGVQYRDLHDPAMGFNRGASDDNGVDYYLAATKMWMNGPFHRNLLVNLTARATKANQTGMLGFGSADDSGYEFQLETSAGLFLNRHWAVGFEYKQKPDRLSQPEDDWWNVWAVFFANKHVSVMAAFADLGSIIGSDRQRGPYISLQFAL